MAYHEYCILHSLFAIAIVAIVFPGFDATETAGDGDGAFDSAFEKSVRKIPVHEKCLAFFKDYIQYAGEYARCELKYAFPFRMCEMCVEKYVITTSTYNDLVMDKDLDECRTKYMKSDRVQIFPMVEDNMDAIWSKADCKSCFEDLSINHTTKAVTYKQPGSVTRFMEFYNNLSICMNSSLEANNFLFEKKDIDVCTVCLDNYTALNKHYNDMSSHLGDNVCMDIVDRMNYTRLIWSHHFNCSCRPSEPASIIVIALVIASTPIFFYIIVRVTGKEKKKKLLKQKRLNLSGQNSHASSVHHSLWRPNNYRNYHSLAET